MVLSVLLAAAAAKPSILSVLPIEKTTTTIIEPVQVDIPVVKNALIQEHGTVEIKEPTITKVGDLVRSFPTAVSHQSSTIVHNKADYVEPILAHGVRTYQQPIVKTYSTPIVENIPLSTPIVKKYETPLLTTPLINKLEGAPLIQTYGATPLIKGLEGTQLIKGLESTPLVQTYGANQWLLNSGLNPGYGYYYSYGYGEPYYRNIVGAAPLTDSTLRCQ